MGSLVNEVASGRIRGTNPVLPRAPRTPAGPDATRKFGGWLSAQQQLETPEEHERLLALARRGTLRTL